MAAEIGETKSVTTWKEGATFEHLAPSGVPYQTDAILEGEAPRERRGPLPMELLLGSVGGCTGVDLVGMFRKMRLELRRLRIEVTGKRQAEHPRVYRRVHIDYHVETDPVDARKVLRAIDLSAKKYCSASATVAALAEMTYTLHYAGEKHEGVVHGARSQE